ncbi:hypothetical protein [Clostridium sediminicola]|uniref:hypothetical protein n=1 Tax=Clostridium sediminicola TaxID=3114879 RepID=UPI003D16EA33
MKKTINSSFTKQMKNMVSISQTVENTIRNLKLMTLQALQIIVETILRWQKLLKRTVLS